MKIIGKKLSIEEFREYIKNKTFGSIPPNELVIHHTWRPTIDQWKGIKSINGLKTYYESKGWPAGPHIFVAEDGIWLFTDVYNVGIHAGKANATWTKNGKNGTGYPPYGSKIKSYSIGVEVVGNYDSKKWSGKTKANALHVIDILRKKLSINNDKITFHRDYSRKTCPGTAIKKGWLYGELDGLDSVTSQPSEWAKEAWEWATKMNYMDGTRPQDAVTREELAVVLRRYNAF